MQIDPKALSIEDRYKLLIGAVVPRPIAFVSTCSPSDPSVTNLAPFSFFAGVGSNPMTMLFCPANTPDGREKDTLRNCKPLSEGGQGELVINIVPHALAQRMAACAEPLPYGDSEFDLAHLTRAASVKVKPPRVAESPISFECRTLSVIRTNPGQPAGGNVVLAEVLYIHAAEELVNDRRHVDPSILDAIGRMGGGSYCTTRDRFDMPMGRKALG